MHAVWHGTLVASRPGLGAPVQLKSLLQLHPLSTLRLFLVTCAVNCC